MHPLGKPLRPLLSNTSWHQRVPKLPLLYGKRDTSSWQCENAHFLLFPAWNRAFRNTPPFANTVLTRPVLALLSAHKYVNIPNHSTKKLPPLSTYNINERSLLELLDWKCFWNGMVLEYWEGEKKKSCRFHPDESRLQVCWVNTQHLLNRLTTKLWRL